MPQASAPLHLGGKAEVWCGECDRRRVNEDDPRAVRCERGGCSKTIIESPPDGEKEG